MSVDPWRTVSTVWKPLSAWPAPSNINELKNYISSKVKPGSNITSLLKLSNYISSTAIALGNPLDDDATGVGRAMNMCLLTIGRWLVLQTFDICDDMSAASHIQGVKNVTVNNYVELY